MSLFVCDECDVVENTALAGVRGYHLRKHPVSDKERAERPDIDFGDLGDGKARCSLCNPEVGKWHGLFPREKYDERTDSRRRVVNREPTG